MFSPVGYTPLYRLVRNIQISGNHLLRGDWEALQRGEDCIEEMNTLMDHSELEIMSYFSDNLHVYSEDGRIFKFDLSDITEHIFLSSDIFECTGHDFGGDGLLADFFERQNLGNTHDYEMESTFLTENSSSQHVRLWTETYRTVPIFHDRATYTVSCRGYRLMKKYNPNQIYAYDSFYKIVRKFEGFSICVDTNFICDDTEKSIAMKIYSQYETYCAENGLDIDTLLPIGRPAAGRPAVRIKAAMHAYGAIYPQGHAETPFKTVLSNVRERTGMTVSPDTLRRAIGRVAAEKDGPEPQS